MKRSQKSFILRSMQVLVNILISIFVLYDVMGMGDRNTLTGVKAFLFFGISQITLLEMFWERRDAKLPQQRYFLGGWVTAYAAENLAFWLLPLTKGTLLIVMIIISVAEILFAMMLFKGRYTLPTGVSLIQIGFAMYVGNHLFNQWITSGGPREGVDVKTWMATKVFFSALIPLLVTWLQTYCKSGVGVDVFIALFTALMISVAWATFTMNANLEMSTNCEYYFSVGIGSLIYLAYLSVAGKPTKLIDVLKNTLTSREDGEEK